MSNPRTFACPGCKEIINDSVRECRFCGAPVDPATAHAAADLQATVNQACSDASYLKTTAIAMFMLLGLSFIPLLPLVDTGFRIIFVIALVLAARWQVKYLGVKTDDPDYGRARRSKNVALVLLGLALPLGFVVRPLMDSVILQLLLVLPSS